MINMEFGKNGIFTDEQNINIFEKKVSKETATKCLTDTIKLMLEKLTSTERKDILDQICVNFDVDSRYP
jgi:hypothetical protein